MRKETFNIIKFESINQGIDRYFPSQIESTGLWKDLLNLEQFTQLLTKKLPLGKSRYGGAIVDFPKNTAFPDTKKWSFMAQINLVEFKPYDKNNLLPKDGHLFFFMDMETDKGKTLFFEGNNQDLERFFITELDDIWGTLEVITNISSEHQKWEANYQKLEKEELKCPICKKSNIMDCNCDITGMFWHDREDIIEKKYIWDASENTYTSKMFGIYADVQCGEKEIEEVTFSDKIVLFQVGEDINDEGIFSVLIGKENLKKLDFDKCTYRWSQT